ncbi:MAG: hypothetical protein GXP42_09170, partial [Chloroflexi bacterium]|nr:hypothetical protein [Chloroflexota bacterium]
PIGAYRRATAPPEYVLAPGSYTVTFYLRESGARLDKWQIRLQATRPTTHRYR